MATTTAIITGIGIMGTTIAPIAIIIGGGITRPDRTLGSASVPPGATATITTIIVAGTDRAASLSHPAHFLRGVAFWREVAVSRDEREFLPGEDARRVADFERPRAWQQHGFAVEFDHGAFARPWGDRVVEFVGHAPRSGYRMQHSGRWIEPPDLQDGPRLRGSANRPPLDPEYSADLCGHDVRDTPHCELAAVCR